MKSQLASHGFSHYCYLMIILSLRVILSQPAVILVLMLMLVLMLILMLMTKSVVSTQVRFPNCFECQLGFR